MRQILTIIPRNYMYALAFEMVLKDILATENALLYKDEGHNIAALFNKVKENGFFEQTKELGDCAKKFAENAANLFVANSTS